MPIELLFLMLAWAAIVCLLVVIPWAIIRLTVGVLEADVSMPGADRGRAQNQQSTDSTAVTELSREIDDTGDSEDVVPSSTLVEEDTDSETI
jgi:hypothetical protein